MSKLIDSILSSIDEDHERATERLNEMTNLELIEAITATVPEERWLKFTQFEVNDYDPDEVIGAYNEEH